VISDEIADSDILLVEDTVNTLIEDLIRLNFATPPEIPKFSFPLEKTLEDLETRSRIYVNLNSIGYKPSPVEIQDEFGFEPVEAPQSAAVIKASDMREDKKEDEKAEDAVDEYLKEIWQSVK
jgi:hypothetical protein